MAKLIRIETKTSDNEELVYNVTETAKNFAYDGCHKCYILETENDEADLKSFTHFRAFPLEDLAKIFIGDTCGMRFIDDWSLNKQIVPQCSVYAKFIYDDGSCEVYDINDYGEKEDEDEDDDEE